MGTLDPYEDGDSMTIMSDQDFIDFTNRIEANLAFNAFRVEWADAVMLVEAIEKLDSLSKPDTEHYSSDMVLLHHNLNLELSTLVEFINRPNEWIAQFTKNIDQLEKLVNGDSND